MQPKRTVRHAGRALVFIVLGGPALLAAEDRAALIERSLRAINAEEYVAALEGARALCERDPADPAGHFIRAAAHQTRMSDYRVRRWEREFETEIDAAVRKSRAWLARDPSAENHFVLGAAEAYRCYYSFRRGRWWKALRAASATTRYLGEARRLDPEFADPLLGLALYQYGLRKVRVLGISLGRRSTDDVVTDLEQVRDHGRFVSVNALYGLQMIRFESRDFTAALAVNDRLHEAYPRNPVCLYNRALILEHLGRTEEAAAVWRRLLDVLGTAEAAGEGFLAECRYRLSRLHARAGRSTAAAEELAAALAHLRRTREDEELDGPYESLETVRRAADQLARRATAGHVEIGFPAPRP